MSHRPSAAAPSILMTSLSLPAQRALPIFAHTSKTLAEGVPPVNPVPSTQQCSLNPSSAAVGMKGRNPDVDNNQGLRTFKLFWRLYTCSPGQGTFLPVPAMPRHLPRQIRRALETLRLIHTAGTAAHSRTSSPHTGDLLPLLLLLLPFLLCNPPTAALAAHTPGTSCLCCAYS